MKTETLPTPKIEHVCDLAVKIGPPIEIGETIHGRRRVIPILGGIVSGPRLSGSILLGGADFQVIVGNTTAEMDARYVIELDGGGRVYVRNSAMRYASADVTNRLSRGETVDPSQVYFRCQPTFETSEPQHVWMQHRQFVGTGLRRPDAVYLTFFCVM